ncbi:MULTISPECIES: OmpA family protein [Spongiibacter]|jgi:outer membrane protein OmpA-like peptidoglycan-associated protein|uniref:OmpA family protein n=1 Tax=Spongiibacter TaxID=630749 RepID=UPI001EF8B3AE|nr:MULTISPECIES: OmpA family protein [Spongiibacter]MBM7421870.1 outer membrane protein OmpA-like peptidoglycan-associated protein [Spongiibacter marinus]|tara:strand:- start:5075 stop:5746 length:672 start_codon:yes stop_codon:yes gene_type:complete
MIRIQKSMRLVACITVALFVTACSIDPYTGEEKASNTAKGAGWGALGGAVLGAAVSSKKDRKKGALIGAAAGAAAGGGYGYYMDRQEAKLRARLEGTGVGVQRVGDTIKLIMPGNITFDTGSSVIMSGFTSVLDSVALVAKEFDKTLMQVNGYTDSTGSFQTNQTLSEQRAGSVARYFMNQGVASSRIRATGYGPRDPIADNSTASGRAQNRRVEIELLPMQQ